MTRHRRAGDAAARCPHRRAACFAALAVIAVAAPACSAGTGLTGGTTVAACARALPAAQDALRGDRGRLLGVHLVPADKLPSRVKAELPTEDDTDVCAIAFRGTFAAGTVAGARSGVAGDFAVVLVDEKRLTVVASFVGDRLPKALRGHLI